MSLFDKAIKGTATSAETEALCKILEENEHASAAFVKAYEEDATERFGSDLKIPDVSKFTSGDGEEVNNRDSLRSLNERLNQLIDKFQERSLTQSEAKAIWEILDERNARMNSLLNPNNESLHDSPGPDLKFPDVGQLTKDD